MRKHTTEEIMAMTQLIEESINELLSNLFGESHLDARRLVKTFDYKIVEILDMPYGGTLAPEEIAQMILSEVDLNRYFPQDEAAACSLA